MGTAFLFVPFLQGAKPPCASRPRGIRRSDLDLDQFGPSFIMFHQLLHGEVASLKRASNSGGKGYLVRISRITYSSCHDILL